MVVIHTDSGSGLSISSTALMPCLSVGPTCVVCVFPVLNYRTQLRLYIPPRAQKGLLFIALRTFEVCGQCVEQGYCASGREESCRRY